MYAHITQSVNTAVKLVITLQQYSYPVLCGRARQPSAALDDITYPARMRKEKVVQEKKGMLPHRGDYH